MLRSNIRFYNIIFNNSIKYNIFYALLYILIFDYIWEHFESVYFDYEGIIYNNEFIRKLIGFCVALYPIIFYRGLITVSSWISLLIYYFGYVPVIMGFCLDLPSDSPYEIESYYIVLSLAMCAFFYADRRAISFNVTSKKKIDIKIIWITTAILTLILFITFKNNMRLVSFQDIYQLREENSQSDVTGIGYFYGWCSSFFYPFVFCYGLIMKKRKFICIGTILFIFLYSIMGQKVDLFSPVMLFVLYYIFKWQDKHRANVMGPISLGVLLLAIIIFLFIDTLWGFGAGAVFFSRTLGVSAYHVPMYLDFFHNNPYTYFSHINFVNFFTQSYPYKESIGAMVAGEDGVVSNAIFWQMDGIASCGVLGCVIISFIVYYFLLLMNGLGNNRTKYLINTLMLSPIAALLNVSFFTTILSKGVFFIFLTIYFVRLPFIYDSK